MKVNEFHLNKKETEKKSGRTGLLTLECLKVESSLAKEIFGEKMEAITRANSQTIIFVALEDMSEVMDENTKGFGRIIKCMEKGLFIGPMEGFTKVSLRMT